MKVYLFKVRDFTTILVGQFKGNQKEWPYDYFYIERGDGKKIIYDTSRIEWSKEIYNEEDFV